MKYTHKAENDSKNQAADFVHFIPYVNCPDLLGKAVFSTIPTAREGIGIIIDNRSDRISLPSPVTIIEGTEAESCFSVLEPDVPLTTAQVMNLMVRISIGRGVKFFTWIHGDGEVRGDSLRLIRDARQRNSNGEKWGAIFTAYDIYCAFSIEGCQATGDWDWLQFPYYFLDNDYYHRLKTAGYPCVNIGGDEVVHHNDASNTIKNDRIRRRLNHYLFPVQEQLFKEKYPQGTN